MAPQLALSSDKISSLQTPLLHLSLDVREEGVQRSVNLELDRDELSVLISALEAANKVRAPSTPPAGQVESCSALHLHPWASESSAPSQLLTHMDVVHDSTVQVVMQLK